MDIRIDEERLTMDEKLSLLEVLAQISDRAQAQRRIVTGLQIGDRRLTDRDLNPALLAKRGREVGSVQATTQSVEDVVAQAEESVRKYAGLLKDEGRGVVQAMRAGKDPGAALNSWLGKLANYVEIREAASKHRVPGSSVDSIVPWITKLLDARTLGDTVCGADLLEYEILPRLGA
jgi:hypothetical protein